MKDMCEMTREEFWKSRISRGYCPTDFKLENKVYPTCIDSHVSEKCKTCWAAAVKDIVFADEVKVKKYRFTRNYLKQHVDISVACKAGDIVNVKEDRVYDALGKWIFDLGSPDSKLYGEVIEVIEKKKEVEKVEETKTYKAWEILKMIGEGKLKDNDIIISKGGAQSSVAVLKRDNYSVENLMNDGFRIKEKEYYTLAEAIEKAVIEKKED